MRLKDKIAIVTGAASGIGKEIALIFAREGARVAIADLAPAPAEAAAAELRTGGGQAMAVTMDVTDEDQVSAGVAAVVKQWGGVDILVSNAGIQIVHPARGHFAKLLPDLLFRQSGAYPTETTTQITCMPWNCLERYGTHFHLTCGHPADIRSCHGLSETHRQVGPREAPTPPPGGGKILYDDSVAGFGLRLTPAGARSFIFNYRVRKSHRERRYTIGNAGRWEDGKWREGSWTVAAARERARELDRIVDAGGDPMGDLHEARAAPTIDELADRYLAEHASRKRPRGLYEDGNLLKQWIRPELGNRKVGEVQRDDLEKLHRKITDAGTPVRANRAIAVASSMFACSVRWGMRADNPARGVKRNREHARTRYLSQQELASLMAALASHPNQDAAAAIQLLALTGCRRGEALKAEWDQFDLSRREWVKPPQITKANREHRVPLSVAAVELLTSMKQRAADDAAAPARASSSYLFPSGRIDGNPVMNIRRVWLDVCQKSRLRGATMHTLRHSFASYLVSSGLGLPVVASLLGHRNIATSARYSHLVDDVLRKGVDRVGSIVAAAQTGKSAEILPLRSRGRRRS
jgi:integrase